MEKQNRPKYKFGQDEIDLKNYIHNLDTNAQSYLNSRNWSNDQKQEFMTSYNNLLSKFREQLDNNTNRFSTDTFGTIIDSNGEISNDDNVEGTQFYYDDSGNKISSQDYNNLKDRKKKNYSQFYANKEVASYFNIIGNALRNKIDKSQPSSSNKFDLSQQGFVPTWSKTNNPSGGDFDLTPYVNLDEPQEDGTRKTEKRVQYLQQELQNYLNNGNYTNLDFSETPYKNVESYKNSIQNAINALNNGYNSESIIALNKAGISSDFLNPFFKTKNNEEVDENEEGDSVEEQYKKLGYTDEQISTIMQAQQIQEQQQKEGLVQQAQEIINNRNMEQWINSLKNKPFQSRVNLNLSTYKPSYNEKWVVDNFNRSYNKDALNWLNHELQLNYFIDPNKQRIFRGKLNSTYQHLSNNLDWAIKSQMLDNNKISENLYAIPTTLDYDRQSVIVYNPNSGQVQEVSLLNYLDSPKVQKWLSDYYYNNVAKHKEGGVLKYQSGGDFDNFYNYINNFDQIQKQKEEEKLKPIKEKAERENITLDQAKARERKLSEGLSGEDWTRIGASVLDIISAGSSYIPVYGTAVSAASGVASTLANLGADAADESVTSGQMWRNLGYGLGMDAIGLIPGLGTSAKAAKVARVLRPVSKALVRALQVSTIKDAVSAVPSIQKVISNPKDATTEDLRKISVGIQALLGAHRGQVGINTNNKYTSDITTNILTTKSGKNAKISVDQLKELKKKKGYDEQNEYFKSITEGQELPKEFKHYNDNWFKRPFTYLFRSGPEVEVQREVKLLPGVEYSKWGIYRKTNQNNKKKTNQTSKQTPKQKPKLSSQQIQRLESLGYTKLTPQDIKIINHQRQLFGKPKLTEEEIKRLQSRESRQKNNSPKSFLERLADFKQNKQKNKNQWTVEDARKELQEAERQQKLGVPVQGSEIIKPEASQVRFINRLNQYIPVVHKVKPVTKNVPAVIPRPNYNIQLQGYQSPFNFRTITDNLNRLDRERLGRDIGQTRVQRAVENNPLRIERIQDQKARDNVSRYFNLYGIPYYKDQLYGAARKNRQNMYNQLFGERYYAMQDALRNRELPHRQSKKKKKTSRDDKVTRKQQGGVLDLTKIKKFQNAGKITLNNGVVDWDSLSDPKKDILWPGSAEYSKSPLSKYVVPRLGTSSGVNNVSKSQNYSFDTNSRLKSMIDRLKNNTISPDNISEMQRRHWGMYYTWQPQDTPIYKEQVANYQTDYQNLGLNDEIIAPGYSNNYIINSPNPNSGDSTPNWTSDGLYSQITDDRRVLARKADYDNNPEQLKKDIEYAKQNGYEYYLDPETDYYMLRPLQANENTSNISKLEISNDQSTSKPDNIKGLNIFSNPTLTYGLPRALYADWMNRKMTDLAIKSTNPVLQDPFIFHRYTRSDLDSEMQGEKNYASLVNLANRPTTSSGENYDALRLEAELKGQEAKNKGRQLSNQVQRQYDELAWQQEKENAKNIHDTSASNNIELNRAIQDKNNFKLAYLSKKHNIWDVLGQQFEFEARQKRDENKALKDKFAIQDIHNAIYNNPNAYGTNLTPEELNVWNLVLSGVQPSSLKDKLNLYLTASKKVSQAENNQLRNYYSIPYTKWSNTTPQSQFTPNINFIKNGKKINTKEQDIKRFYKQIKDSIDRNEKAIERLSKSMSKLTKK